MPEDIETFRDHLLSVFQSAVADVAKKLDAKAAVDSGLSSRSVLRRSATTVLPAYAADIARRELARQPEGDLRSSASTSEFRVLSSGDTAKLCVELAFRYLKARISDDERALSEFEGEFRGSACDPAWAGTIEEYLQYFGPSGSRGTVPYIRPAAVGPKSIEITSTARVALIGDWGTGAQPAIQLLKEISHVAPDVLVHLGDIYYSGTPLECNANFASLIETILRQNGRLLPVFTLSGNHDMYCGGIGYYGLIRNLNAAPFVQPASFFCLRTADQKWQLLALDTGLHDYSPFAVDDAVTFLEEDELAWHCERIKEFPGRTILLSHHPLFSAFSPIGKLDQNGKRSAINPNLQKAFEAMRTSGQIAAWFWGHEHSLAIYEPFAELQRGRCLGHSAVPVSIRDDIYSPLPGLDGKLKIIPGTQLHKLGAVYAHGYAVLAFNGNTCSAEYFQDIGGRAELLYSETID